MHLWNELAALGIDPSHLHANVPMSRFTTFRTGGPADLLVDIYNIEEITLILSYAQAHLVPVTFLGNGSNLLVLDGGIRGIVLRFGPGFSAVSCSDTLLQAQAGIQLRSLCRFAMEHGLGGLAPLSGIPGTLGGALIMNAGAYGAEIGSFVQEVTVLDDTGAQTRLPKEALSFGYRTSSLNHCIVLSATLQLSPAAPEDILRDMQEFSRRRKEKQPVEYPSAGSTFKRPEGAFAAALIDQCGLKGCSVGDAQVSPKHAGFVINRGNASSSQILELIGLIQQKVLDETGYQLEPEIRILGTDERKGDLS